MGETILKAEEEAEASDPPALGFEPGGVIAGGKGAKGGEDFPVEFLSGS